MKNLDIEKLERKNIYQVPENFFEEMQAKVMEEVAPEKKAKVFKLNWAYSAAAAIALIFGVTFFVNSNERINPSDNLATSINNDSVTNTLAVDRPEIAVENSSLESRPIVNVEKTDNEIQIVSKPSRGVAVTKTKEISNRKDNTKIISKSAEIPMDQIISSFTSADLADLGRNTEQDIYLDLYN